MEQKPLQERILDRGWTEADLREAGELLREVEADPRELKALRDFDRLRTVMGPGEATENGVAASNEQWDDLVQRARQSANAPAYRIASTYRSLAWAAVLALCAGGWALWWITGNNHTPRATSADRVAELQSPPQALMQDHELMQTMAVFHELEAVYNQRAAWVAVTDDGAEVGLSPEATTDACLLLLRLTLQRAGKPVSQTNLALAHGQYASWTTPGADGKTIRYHVSTSVDVPTQLSIWAESESAPGTPNGQTLAAYATKLPIVSVRAPREHSFVLSAGSDELHVTWMEMNAHEAHP